jgi:6-phosphogluconolactonase
MREAKATLVVSGGSTPRPLFAQLATAKIPWEHVTILLADERWVPEITTHLMKQWFDKTCFKTKPLRRSL